MDSGDYRLIPVRLSFPKSKRAGRRWSTRRTASPLLCRGHSLQRLEHLATVSCSYGLRVRKSRGRRQYDLSMIMFPVADPDEVRYSHYIMQLFGEAEKIYAALDELHPAAGSALRVDDARTPHYPVSGYAHGQLSVAAGCVAALKQMIVRESEKKIEMVAGPHGAYAMVRNALDTAAAALWLLEPMNGTLRIKRRILLELDEAGKAEAFRLETEGKSNKAKRRQRMKEVAVDAGLGTWNPLAQDPTSTTSMLRSLERLHTDKVVSWLAVWQLSSGHAHGKIWAQVASHDLDEIKETRSQVGATFRVTIRYGMLALVLYETLQLIEAAYGRYTSLAALPPA